MSLSTDNLQTAGKITVFTTFIGVVAFAVIFIFNLGEPQIREAVAQSNATTTVTVVNTAPIWTASTTEVIESSTTTPTNSGSVVSWTAIGTDSNGEDYYLIICSTSASPTPSSSAAPTCSAGIQWAVSPAASSGVAAVAATTTYEALPELNNWYGWICDGNSGTPRCNNLFTQGTNATNSSPFYVNHRPVFSLFSDNSPTVPGAVVTFFSTSSDSDTVTVSDTVKLIVCATSGFNTTTDSCSGTLLGSTTVSAAANATATYTVIVPTQDQNYGAFGYIIDNHGHEATGGAQGTDSTLTVANIAPSTTPATISINGGSNMILTVASGQTTGHTLQFTATDYNSCEAVGGGSNDEVSGYALSLYRSGIGSTTCSTAAGAYNANNCYPSGVASTTWNLSCTASSTSCLGTSDIDMVWDCSFPLWYIADPTDGTATSTQYSLQNWLAQVQAVDDDFATGSLAQSSVGVEVTSFLAFALNDISIPYGSLEPGQFNDPILATTTISATGNVGLDKDVIGTDMCNGYTNATPCTPSPTSTIPAFEQVFATGTVSYASATRLSSTSTKEIEINVPKSTATSTQASASAYWGIAVPGTITFAGAYTGQNTFTAKVGESAFW